VVGEVKMTSKGRLRMSNREETFLIMRSCDYSCAFKIKA
jgi:hypothetical protein